MDELWVPNNQLKETLENDGISMPVHVVPHTFDLNKYKTRYPEISIPNTQDNFKFYYIGDMNDRKNLECILTCFYSEFLPSENVSLILKVNKFGCSPKQVEELVNQKVEKVKNDLRMYHNIDKYKKSVIISSMATSEQICSLHQYCDSFLGPSHGEAWSIPAFEAMCFGNSPICSNFGGPKDFIDKTNWRTGNLIDGTYIVCKCSDAAFPDLFTGREYWFQPSEIDLRNQMRTSYESWSKDRIAYKNKNQSAALKRAEMFSYKTVAHLMLEKINE
jgi:glycosyltransferase involved in cell wall biosynthesis